MSEDLPAPRGPEQKGPTALEETEIVVSLLDVEKAFPHTEIVSSVEWHAPKERMPSVARMDMIPLDEIVWLTPRAVKDRIETLLQTDHRFNRKDAVVVAGYARTDSPGDIPFRSHEAGHREQVSPGEMVRELESMGFAFGMIGGKVSLLVDATILVEKNTNGRMKQIVAGSTLTRQVEYHGRRIVAYDEGKTGFRPAVFETSHAIAIPLEDLLALHKRSPDVESVYSMPDQRESRRMTPAREDAMDRMVNFFYDLRTNPEVRESPVAQKVRDIKYADISWKERRVLLYDLLVDLGLEPHILNEGYFPHEPVYSFLNDKKKITMDTLKTHQQDVRDTVQNTGAWTAELMLDELLAVLIQRG